MNKTTEILDLEEIIKVSSFNKILNLFPCDINYISYYQKSLEFSKQYLIQKNQAILNYSNFIKSNYKPEKINVKSNFNFENKDSLIKFLNISYRILRTYSFEDGISKIYSMLPKKDLNLNQNFEIIGNENIKNLFNKYLKIYDLHFNKKSNHVSSKFNNLDFYNLIDFPNSLLLYGPPGTGKTSLINNFLYNLENKYDIPIQLKRIDLDFKSKWYGESTKNLEFVLNSYTEDFLNIYLFEDFDLIIPKRDYDGIFAEKEILRTFMNFFDSNSGKKNILSIFTTNSKHSIDEALLQRIAQKSLCVEGPKSSQDYFKVIKEHLKDIVESKFYNFTDKQLKNLANYSYNKQFSGRQVKDFCLDLKLELIDNKRNFDLYINSLLKDKGEINVK